MKVTPPNTIPKPLLRGHLHQMAFFTALGASLLLIAKSSTSDSTWSCSVYVVGLLLMFGISALYHRPNWRASQMSILKRMDHSAIFVMIAGTMTPFCVLALPEDQGNQMLSAVWIAALAGILKINLWPQAPRFINISLYIAMGWLLFPFLTDLERNMGTRNLWLLITGGVLYTLGGLIYGLQWPKLSPRIFGYHEVFHALVIVAATFHSIVIYNLLDFT